MEVKLCSLKPHDHVAEWEIYLDTEVIRESKQTRMQIEYLSNINFLVVVQYHSIFLCSIVLITFDAGLFFNVIPIMVLFCFFVPFSQYRLIFCDHERHE